LISAKSVRIAFTIQVFLFRTRNSSTKKNIFCSGMNTTTNRKYLGNWQETIYVHESRKTSRKPDGQISIRSIVKRWQDRPRALTESDTGAIRCLAEASQGDAVAILQKLALHLSAFKQNVVLARPSELQQ